MYMFIFLFLGGFIFTPSNIHRDGEVELQEMKDDEVGYQGNGERRDGRKIS